MPTNRHMMTFEAVHGFRKKKPKAVHRDGRYIFMTPPNGRVDQCSFEVSAAQLNSTALGMNQPFRPSR